MNVCSQLYVQIRAIYVQHTSQIVLYTYTTYHIRTRTYTHVYARICTYLTSKEQYVGLTGAVCECISNEYVQILTPCWGHRLYVYERICTYLFRNTYIYVQYVYVRICNYTCIYVLHVYARIFLSKYGPYICQKYVHMHTVTVLSRLLCVHRRRRKSLHFRRAVATASLSRGSASACRSPNSIISGLRD